MSEADRLPSLPCCLFDIQAKISVDLLKCPRSIFVAAPFNFLHFKFSTPVSKSLDSRLSTLQTAKLPFCKEATTITDIYLSIANVIKWVVVKCL